jgi:hypothetical protein
MFLDFFSVNKINQIWPPKKKQRFISILSTVICMCVCVCVRYYFYMNHMHTYFPAIHVNIFIEEIKTNYKSIDH